MIYSSQGKMLGKNTCYVKALQNFKTLYLGNGK